MNNNFEAINYYKNKLNDLGEINEQNKTEYSQIIHVLNILFDNTKENGVAFINGPHNSIIKDKYEEDINYLEVILNPMVKEVSSDETNVDDIEIEPIIPTEIDTDILNNIENEQKESEEKKNNMDYLDEEIDEVEYIPGTLVPKPRERGIYESDSEYIEYLKNHYDKYAEFFNNPSNEDTQELPVINPENNKERDTIPEGRRIVPRPNNDIVPVEENEEKKKNRFKITNVFTPVKDWANKFKKLVWPKVKKAIIPLGLAAALIAGTTVGLKGCKKESNSQPEMTFQNSYDNEKENNFGLGQTLNLNNGTPIYRNSDYTGIYGVIGEENSYYDTNTSFVVNAVNLIDEKTNEEKEFSLVKKNQEEKKQIINDYFDYIANNNYKMKNLHVTPVDENGKWIDESGLGAWLDPNTLNNYSEENGLQRRLS